MYTLYDVQVEHIRATLRFYRRRAKEAKLACQGEIQAALRLWEGLIFSLGVRGEPSVCGHLPVYEPVAQDPALAEFLTAGAIATDDLALCEQVARTAFVWDKVTWQSYRMPPAAAADFITAVLRITEGVCAHLTKLGYDVA